MTIKLFEIRDSMTCIPVMAVRLRADSRQERFLLKRSGYGERDEIEYVILCKLDGVEAHYDPFDWSNARTMRTAHRYIIDSWETLSSGDVVDVEFILGETSAPKQSEAVL